MKFSPDAESDREYEKKKIFGFCGDVAILLVCYPCFEFMF